MSRLTIEEVLSADVLSDLTLSKDASRVVYCVRPHYQSGEHPTSALWTAETSVEASARKLTAGTSNDHWPCFHPTSPDIYFLSDRHKAGGSAHLYTLPISAALDQEPEPVAPLDGLEAVSTFAISPDGHYIAFISQRKTHEPGAKEIISVWREKKELGRLRLIDLRKADGPIRTLVSVDAHVDSFSWRPDSSSIIYRLCSHPDVESTEHPVTEAVVSIANGDEPGDFVHPRLPGSTTIWRKADDLIFLQNTSTAFLSSRSLWMREITGSAPVHLKYGETEDAVTVVNLDVKSQYAVEVASGLQSRFDVFDADHTSFAAFETSDDSISKWDMKRVGERYVFVAFRSSGVRGEPLDLWSGETQWGKKGVLSKKLSSHHHWLSPGQAPLTQPFYWTGTDRQSLQGVISYPTGKELRKLPTIVVPHGGPLMRDTLSLSFEDWGWRQLLASRGCLVLSPNYRGSIGRGDAFVRPANGGMGTLDWEDVQTMIDAGVSQGLVDPDRLAIAGYSQGGFLAAWGCTRPNSTFKVGIIGAGVTDWGLLAATSDLPDYETALGGGAPWSPGPPVYRHGSPIKDCKNVRAPLLFLHGKEDKRVPLTQAIALLRGVEREADGCPKPTLVIYPREDHIFKERGNAEDVLHRLIEHIDTYLQ